MTTTIETATKAASSRWQAAFNAGDAAGCAACYEAAALMVAKPFGEFNGRQAIQEFWQRTIDSGLRDIVYLDPKIEIIDDSSAILSAEWKMNKVAGVITKELWVLQPDGTALLREDHFEANV
ncbi:MAG: DUF4440 domain-containing protein [Pseudomonadota bacterium]